MMKDVCRACGAIAVMAIEEGKLGGWQITTIVLGLGVIGLIAYKDTLNYNYKLQSLGIGTPAMRLSDTSIRG